MTHDFVHIFLTVFHVYVILTSYLQFFCCHPIVIVQVFPEMDPVIFINPCRVVEKMALTGL